jgi:transposase
VAESRLEGGACLENRPEAAGFRGRDGHEHLAFGAAARLVATRTKGLLLGASQSGTEHHAAFEHDAGGHGPVPTAVEGTTTGAVFEAYVERVLCPVLCPGQIVVMDNLSAHKGERVRELIEGRGCEVLYLPPYSPDLNPIEEAFAKIKGVLRKAEARNRETLIEAIGRAISAVTAQDVRGFFEHCGYGVSVQSL